MKEASQKKVELPTAMPDEAWEAGAHAGFGEHTASLCWASAHKLSIRADMRQRGDSQGSGIQRTDSTGVGRSFQAFLAEALPGDREARGTQCRRKSSQAQGRSAFYPLRTFYGKMGSWGPCSWLSTEQDPVCQMTFTPRGEGCHTSQLLFKGSRRATRRLMRLLLSLLFFFFHISSSSRTPDYLTI